MLPLMVTHNGSLGFRSDPLTDPQEEGPDKKPFEGLDWCELHEEPLTESKGSCEK